MALYTTLASLSQTAGSNAADGSVDAPATIDNNMNLLASFIAQLRDGNGFATGVGYAAQCRLVKSGSNVVLQRLNGTGLTINGVTYAIPSAGVSLAPTGLTVSTLYYIYAYMNAGTMTLEASTTGHSTDTTTGIEIKTADASRTLVGMVRPVTGPAFADIGTQRFVLSWFNRRPITGIFPLGGNVATTSGTYTEVEVTWRPTFLAWSGDVVSYRANGTVIGTTTSTVAMALYLNGGSLATGVTDAYTEGTIPTGTYLMPFSVSDAAVASSDGFSSISLYGRTNAGTATWKGSASVGDRSSISVLIQG